MKSGIHPKYKKCAVACACGATFETRSVLEKINVEICSKCHPFYTGKQKLVDTAGRVEKFQRRYSTASYLKTAGVAKVADAPETADVPKVEEAPKAEEAPEAAEAPKAEDATESVDAATVEDAPETADATKTEEQ